MPFDYAQRQVRVLLDQHDGFAPLIAALDDDIAALCAALDPRGLYETLPGVGPAVRAGLCAVFGSPEAIVRRFPDASHLVSFAGLDPLATRDATMGGGAKRRSLVMAVSGASEGG